MSCKALTTAAAMVVLNEAKLFCDNAATFGVADDGCRLVGCVCWVPVGPGTARPGAACASGLGRVARFPTLPLFATLTYVMYVVFCRLGGMIGSGYQSENPQTLLTVKSLERNK